MQNGQWQISIFFLSSPTKMSPSSLNDRDQKDENTENERKIGETAIYLENLSSRLRMISRVVAS